MKMGPFRQINFGFLPTAVSAYGRRWVKMETGPLGRLGATWPLSFSFFLAAPLTIEDCWDERAVRVGNTSRDTFARLVLVDNLFFWDWYLKVVANSLETGCRAATTFKALCNHF
jgi:hypothetical protein